MASWCACGRFSKSRGLSASVSFLPLPPPSFNRFIYRPVILCSRTAQKRLLRRLISDIMSYTEETSIPGIALFLDFKTASDTIEWDLINNCLKILKFGPDIQSWFKDLWNNVNSCVLNNGYVREFFSLERGVRQGCPACYSWSVQKYLRRLLRTMPALKPPYTQMIPLFLFLTLILLPICYQVVVPRIKITMFQYKIIHSVLATNASLFRVKKRD